MPSYFITGANKGIGQAAVKKVLEASEANFVYLGTRTVANGDKAVADIAAENASLGDRVKVVEIDVSEQSSVDAACEDVRQDLESHNEREPLLGLVNNAGFFSRSDMKMCLDVNVRGPRIVTHAFSKLLHPTEGRVIVVSSIGGPNFLSVCNSKTQKKMTDGSMSWEEIQELMNKIQEEYIYEEKKFSPTMRQLGIPSMLQYSKSLMVPYIFSKACSNAATIVLAKEFPDLAVNCCHPGPIWSDMTVTLNENDLEKMKKKGLLSPEEGTVSIMHLLSSDEISGRGQYYDQEGKVAPMVQAPAGILGTLINFVGKFR